MEPLRLAHRRLVPGIRRSASRCEGQHRSGASRRLHDDVPGLVQRRRAHEGPSRRPHLAVPLRERRARARGAWRCNRIGRSARSGSAARAPRRNRLYGARMGATDDRRAESCAFQQPLPHVPRTRRRAHASDIVGRARGVRGHVGPGRAHCGLARSGRRDACARGARARALPSQESSAGLARPRAPYYPARDGVSRGGRGWVSRRWVLSGPESGPESGAVSSSGAANIS